jgi:hypothetical protein
LKNIKKILRVIHNLYEMDSEDEEETDEKNDDDVIYKPAKIKVDEEYEVKNGLLGLKRDIILKLTTPMNEEDDLRNLFSISKEMNTFKNTSLFKRLRYFPPIVRIKYGQPERNDDEYEIRGNRVFVSKEYMTDCIIDYKMYENTGIYRWIRTTGIL